MEVAIEEEKVRIAKNSDFSSEFLGIEIEDINRYLQEDPKVNDFIKRALHIAEEYIKYAQHCNIFPVSSHTTEEDKKVVEFAVATTTPRKELIEKCLATLEQTEVERAIIKAQFSR